MNTCGSHLKAVDHANSCYSDGYCVTGVGVVICARHGLIRKNGICNSQRGERFVNMDFIMLSTLSGVSMMHLFLIYDIACQWSKRFSERCADFPSNLQPPIDPRRIVYAIPKGHIKSHGRACQTKFSLNFLPGSGRTDGESVERDWAHMNGLVPSTREMGSGNRQETLDDHWNWWNWEKVKGLGQYMFIMIRQVNALILA